MSMTNGEVISWALQGSVVVTRSGKPVAVLVGVEDEDELERLLVAYSPRLREVLDASREQIASGKRIEHH